jgi:hypothetical protein
VTARTPRQEHWEIEALDPSAPDTDYEVRQGRKRKTVARSEGAAREYVAARLLEGQKVYAIEADGYRFDITRRFTPKTRPTRSARSPR